MRLAAVVSAATVFSLVAIAPATATTKHATGTLVGLTKINRGCPGPVSPPNECNPWRPLPHATFTITRLNSTGAQIRRTRRVVTSDSNAAFRVVLRTGSYLVKPIPGAKNEAGSPHRVHISVGTRTRTIVRYTAIVQPA